MKTDNGNLGDFSSGLLLLLTIAAGITVANLYYSQPLLSDIAYSFKVSQTETGAMFALAMSGYSLGLFFLVPLGDMYAKRNVIISLMWAILCALLFVVLAPNIICLSVALFLLGLVTVVPQIIVPFAAGLAANQRRAYVVGFVMSGVLVGVLLARALSGLLNSFFGWRVIYVFAIVLNALILIFFYRMLPGVPVNRNATAVTSYAHLFSSMVGVWKTYPELIYFCFMGASCFAAFCTFWTNFSFYASGSPFFFPSSMSVCLPLLE